MENLIHFKNYYNGLPQIVHHAHEMNDASNNKLKDVKVCVQGCKRQQQQMTRKGYRKTERNKKKYENIGRNVPNNNHKRKQTLMFLKHINEFFF